jgi:hypothetical protein
MQGFMQGRETRTWFASERITAKVRAFIVLQREHLRGPKINAATLRAAVRLSPLVSLSPTQNSAQAYSIIDLAWLEVQAVAFST